MQTISAYAIPGIKNVKNNSTLTVPPQQIIAAAAKYYNCTPQQITIKNRKRQVIDRRALICLYLRSRGYTLQTIATAFNQDHTTILHAVANAKNLIKLYTPYQTDYHNLVLFLDK